VSEFKAREKYRYFQYSMGKARFVLAMSRKLINMLS